MPRHTIQVASRRSGVTPIVIRAWEKRYEALCPHRCENQSRLYRDEDIARLVLLKQLTDLGHRIGKIAKLSNEVLREMICAERTAQGTGHGKVCYLTACETAVLGFDASMLRSLLEQALAQLGSRATLRRVIVPLVEQIGEGWRQGRVGEAQEHLCSVVIRDFLSAPPPGGDTADALKLLVSTPVGVVHELGALLVAATARDLGWKATHLGLSLPASEIVKAAKAVEAKAVALSVVFPPGCKQIASELNRVREQLPLETALILGGRSACSYRDKIQGEGAVHWPSDLDELETLLATPGAL